MSTEERLRAAFAALADTVDTDPLPVRHRRRWLPVAATAAAVVVLAGVVSVVVVAQQPEPVPQLTPYITTTTPPSTSRVQAPFELYTHCGIDEAKFDGKLYEAEKPIPEPLPAGWGNPTQHGVMTVISSTAIEFTDDLGHVVRFRLRPGATEFKRMCD